MDSYFFILTTIDLFVLGFMSLLTKLSESLNKKQKRGFLLAFALIACISVLEVITIVVDGAPTGCRWLNILSNYLGFGLTPAVALCLVYVLDKKSIIRRGFKAAVCCEGAYLLFLAATLPYGLVFSVSRENLYARGEYFYIYVAMYYAAMLYLMVATVRTAAAFQNRSRTLIYPLTLFLGAETVIQIALPSLHVTWLCVTLLSVLYYIYCSEMWNQLDALTGLLNQNSYLNRTAEMRRSGAAISAGRAAQRNHPFADALPWLCCFFRGGRGYGERPRRPCALLCQKRAESPRRSGNARRRQWGKGLNGSFGGKKRPHTL